MAEREFIDEVVIAENGSLKTIASYYKGHLPLDHYVNMNGQHVEGFTGPETRFVTKKLFPSRIIEIHEVVLFELEETHARS